jgi:cell wall-associated NlpC family hydrolase
MKTKTLLFTAVAFAICGSAFAQSWEQKYQQADAELNRVYKELRSNLNELEKVELKKVQIAWLKDKERAVQSVNSINEKLRMATSLTLQRTEVLRRGISDAASNAENSAGMPMLSDREASKRLAGKWAHYHGSKYEITFVFKSDGSFNQQIVIQRAGEKRGAACQAGPLGADASVYAGRKGGPRPVLRRLQR